MSKSMAVVNMGVFVLAIIGAYNLLQTLPGWTLGFLLFGFACFVLGQIVR